MSTHKSIDIICIAAALLAVILTVLLTGGGSLGIITVMGAEAGNDLFTANDLNADWDTSSATKITLSDSGSTISGNGAYTYEGNIYIVYAGRYVLTGELTNGSIIIDADKNDKIWISLNGVTLHCEDDAAIRIEQADKVFLTLADGTENTISSGAQYNEESLASGVDGVIYSRDDLTINGTGTLSVDAAYYHGIVCNDDLVIAGGNITVNAVQDGIHANDSVRIRDAVISVSAGDDGITVSNDDETAFLYIESGEITILTCYEGLEAIDITIAGGTINIRATDDGINANGTGSSSVIRITGGDITIINSSGRDADGLDSNGDIYIEGGRLFISMTDTGGNCAIDYGSENGGECVISGGTVIACGGSAMAESFDTDSPQGFLMYYTSAAANTTIRLTDSLGTELLSEEIPCSFSSVLLSTPELKTEDSCTIEINGIQEQLTIDNNSSGSFTQTGMFGGMRGGGNHEAPDFSGSQKGGRQEGFMPDMSSEIPSDLPSDMPSEIPSDVPSDTPPDMSSDMSSDLPSDSDMPQNIFPQENNREFGDKQEPGGGGKMNLPDGESRSGRQLYADETISSSVYSVHTLVLVGISVFVLLIGLLIAIKVKH